MRIFDRTIDFKNYVETLVLPKGDEKIVFKARPVSSLDYETFEKLFPEPKAPTFFKPGSSVAETDSNDAFFLDSRKAYREARTNYMFMVSLSATEGLVWDTVVATDPKTWGNIQTELKAAGFLDSEIVMLFNLVISANGLDSEKIRKATESFLAMEASQAR